MENKIENTNILRYSGQSRIYLLVGSVIVLETQGDVFPFLFFSI